MTLPFPPPAITFKESPVVVSAFAVLPLFRYVTASTDIVNKLDIIIICDVFIIIV
jgi:hypothetical protein